MFADEPTITPWEILVLVGQLPEDSATVAALKGGPEFRAWTQQMYLLSAQTNLLFAANRQRAGKVTRTPLVKPPVAKKKSAPKVADLKAIKARIERRELSARLKRAAERS